MPIIAIILTLEIAVSALLVNVPSTTPQKETKVLSQSILLADDQNPPADQSTFPDQSAAPDQTTSPDQASPQVDSSNPNSPEQTPSSTDSTIPSQPPETNQTPATPSESTPLPQQTISPDQLPSSSETTPTTTKNSTSSPEPPEGTTSSVPSPEVSTTSVQEKETTITTPEQSASISADIPILNTDKITSNLSQISSQSQEEAAAEDVEIATVTDPNTKATLLTTFASDKISDIDKFTRDQDFNSTAFAEQRLSDQIEQLKTLSSQMPASGQIQQKLSDLCQQANVTLRTNQEIIPEELEQDLEITRGQCLGY